MSIRPLFFACAWLLAGLGLKAEQGKVPCRSDVDTVSLRLPQPGDHELRVLSPTVLELSQVTEKDPDPAPFGGWRIPSAGESVSTDTFQVRVDGKNVHVESLGWRRRVLYAPVARRDLRVGTYLYLLLADPIARPDAAVEVSNPGRAYWNPSVLYVAKADPLRLSPAIHVNQEGYVPSFPKKAMVGYYLGDLGELSLPPGFDFELVDAHTGESVYRGQLTARPDIGYVSDHPPYQQVLVADFSDFRKPGEYRLLVPGLGASLPFLIDEGIAMGFARTYALGLYEQRCGAALRLPFTRFTHAECHTAPAQIPSPQSDPQFAFTWKTIASYGSSANPNNPAQIAPLLTSEQAQLYPFVRKGSVDVEGGHHDAGDYSKYTINSAKFIHCLIFAADSIDGVAGLDNLGIPESGDGIGDVLQEAKWESDFLSKMQDEDGGFYFLVYPKDREYESNVTPDHGDAQVVWPKNTSVTAASVAALAECASSPLFKRTYPEISAKYLQQARLGWDFLMKAIAAHGKQGAYQKITFYSDNFTHDDELAWAACEMYLATGEPRFQEKLFEWFPNPADPTTFRWGWWKMSECWGNAIRSYAFGARSGRLPLQKLDPRYLAICEGQIIAAADDGARWSANNAYGTAFPTPTKAMQSGGWYFSLDQACDMAIAYQIEPKQQYIDALVCAMNYEGGCNPVNVTYLTGLGVKRQREIVSQFAQNSRRILPPSGIPIGNIQTGFDYLPSYKLELRDLSYPRDDSRDRPYAFYDRWSDAYNVTTEFTALNQARGFVAAAFLACQTAKAGAPWKVSPARILAPAVISSLNQPFSATLQTERGLDHARVTWEGRDQEPAFGPTYRVVPVSNGETWLEAEVEWPDGRRAFASDLVSVSSPIQTWVDDALPAGAVPGSGGGDSWNWVDDNPKPHSGKFAHQSAFLPGLHEHWFTGASSPISIHGKDLLFAWIYIDPAHPPREVMLMWNDGSSWEHRAYWGDNVITYGTNGSSGRHYAGPLPPAGDWVMLSVPASAVSLGGSTVSGMGFSLIDGRATWDAAGSKAR